MSKLTRRSAAIARLRRRAVAAAAFCQYLRDTLALLAAAAVIERDPKRYGRIWDLT